MKPAPLQLEKHFFSKIELETHMDGKVGTPNLLRCQGEISQSKDQPRRFQITFKIKLDANDGQKPTYTGEVHAVGLFRVVDEWPEDKVHQLVEVNGLGILCGAIRELIFNLSSRGPFPPILLNAFSFVPDNPQDAIMIPANEESVNQ